jgi:hypothetical protein
MRSTSWCACGQQTDRRIAQKVDEVADHEDVLRLGRGEEREHFRPRQPDWPRCTSEMKMLSTRMAPSLGPRVNATMTVQ